MLVSTDLYFSEIKSFQEYFEATTQFIYISSRVRDGDYTGITYHVILEGCINILPLLTGRPSKTIPFHNQTVHHRNSVHFQIRNYSSLLDWYISV